MDAIRRNGTIKAVFLAIAPALFYAGCAAQAPAASDRDFIRTKAAEVSAAAADAFASGDHKRALEKFMEALRIDRSVDNRAAEVMDLVNIGRVYIALDRNDRAGAYLTEARRLALLIKDDKLLSEAVSTSAKSDYITGDYPAALKEIDEALTTDARLGAKQGSKLNLKAQILAASGKTDEARQAFGDALEINRKDGNGLETANSYRGIAELDRAANKPGEAVQSYKKAYDIDKQAGDSKKIAFDLEGIAHAKLVEGNLNEAVFYFERSYVVSLNAGMIRQAVESLDNLIKTYKEMGDEGKARYYARMREGILGTANTGKPGQER